MPELSVREFRDLLAQQLPRVLQEDPSIRQFILQLSEEHFADRATTDRRFEAMLAELRQMREEEAGRWEENARRWEEYARRWEENARRWEENQQEIRALVDSVKGLNQRFESTIGALGARWGLSSEASFREGLKAILEQSFPVKVERVVEWDQEGEVFGHPDQVELDLIITDGDLILCEIKSSMSRSDMYSFARKSRFYEKSHGRKPSRLIVISPMVDPGVGDLPQQLGIEVYSSDRGLSL